VPADQDRSAILETNNGAVVIHMMPATVLEDGRPVSVQVDVLPTAPGAEGAVSTHLKTVRIEFHTRSGRPVSRLDRPILIELAYSRAELQTAGIEDPASLHVRCSSDGGVTWTPIPSVVVGDRLMVKVDHLTLFSLAGSKRRQYLPIAAHH
jgi:hypothetical protein